MTSTRWMFLHVLTKTQPEGDVTATQIPHEMVPHCYSLWAVLDNFHQLSGLTSKTQDATVLDSQMSLNVRHIDEVITPPSCLCGSWKAHFNLRHSPVESLSLPALCSPPSGSQSWLPRLPPAHFLLMGRTVSSPWLSLCLFGRSGARI